MGRRTWESLPIKMRPLTGRFNIVVSRNEDYFRNVETYADTALSSSLEAAMAHVNPTVHPRIFIAGGAQIYKKAIGSPHCTHILLTRVHTSAVCDTFFPEIDPIVFRRASHEELVSFVEEDVPKGCQIENGLEFEYTLYMRRVSDV